MAHFQDIQLLRTTYLRGPSIWTYRPVLEVWLDLGVLEDYPSNLLPGFNERLTAWLPGLVEHHCGVGHRGGVFRALARRHVVRPCAGAHHHRAAQPGRHER